MCANSAAHWVSPRVCAQHCSLLCSWRQAQLDARLALADKTDDNFDEMAKGAITRYILSVLIAFKPVRDFITAFDIPFDDLHGFLRVQVKKYVNNFS